MGEMLKVLFRYRWSAPVLADLREHEGSQFAGLRYRLGVQPGALRPALDWLIKAGLVIRNPGHGHPLRPEYLLTGEGELVADKCRILLSALESSEASAVALQKWSAAVLLAVHIGADRYTQIKASVGGITNRALALNLKDLSEVGLVRRELLDSYPPRAVYRLTPAGARLAPLLQLL